MKGARRTEKGGSEGSSEDGPGALRGTRKMDWMGGVREWGLRVQMGE